MKNLTPKQRLFVHEYLVDLNATAAARRAGYSVKRARATSTRLTHLPAIKRVIEEAKKKRQNDLEITSEKWLRELARIYFADVTDYLQRDPKTKMVLVRPFEEFPEGSSRAVEAIEEKVSLTEGRQLKIKLHSKLEAGKLIGQRLGFLKDKVEIPGVEAAIYELSEKFMPAVKRQEAVSKKRSDEPK